MTAKPLATGTAPAPDWIRRFPELEGLEGGVAELLGRSSRVVALPQGSRIFGPGQAPQHLLLLLAGTVRVQQLSEGGREIVLYRVAAGESCVLTTACLMAFEDYLAEGIAETAVEAVAIPRAAFDEALGRSPVFRRLVFGTFSRRVTDLCRVIDEVAFSRIDIRLAQKLLRLADGGGHVAQTHQQLAAELGTAREGISRTLQEFQRRGWVSAARGDVSLIDQAALARLAAQG